MRLFSVIVGTFERPGNGKTPVSFVSYRGAGGAQTWGKRTRYISRHPTAAKRQGFLNPDSFEAEVYMFLAFHVVASAQLSHLACWLEEGRRGYVAPG